MVTETPTPKLNAALAELQTQLPRIAKDLTAKVETRTGGSYQYSYADLSLISREVLPLLGKLGLSFVARPTLREARFVLVYELRHSSGELVDGEYPLPDRGSPQEIGSAITYARRYTLCSVTGVAPDNDDNDAIAAERAALRDRRREEREARRARPADAPAEPAITADQQRRMQEGFRVLGIKERAARIEYVSQVVGRRVKHATDLRQAEADQVLDAIDKRVADGVRPDPQAAEKAAVFPGFVAADSLVEPISADEQEAWLATQQPPDGVGDPL